MYFETFVIKLRLIPSSAGLTIVNTEVVSSLFILPYDCLGFFCFPRLRLWKHLDSWENETNCFPRDQALLSISVEELPASSLHRLMGQGTPPFIFTTRHCDSSFYNITLESFLVLFWILVTFFETFLWRIEEAKSWDSQTCLPFERQR